MADKRGEKVSTEVIRKVYDDVAGVCIEVGPDWDGLGLVEVRTEGQKNIEHFGSARLTMTPELALELASAIRLAANEALPLDPKETQDAEG